MQLKKLQKKLIAILLIFTLIYSHLALITKSYSASVFESLFGTDSDTGHKNIEFEAFFENDGEKESKIESDVNNQDLAIKLNLNVLDSGFLRDAKIEVLESEEGNGLNFEIGKNSIKENSERTKPADIVQETEVENDEETKQNEGEENTLDDENDANTIAVDLVGEDTAEEIESEEESAETENMEEQLDNSNEAFEEAIEKDEEIIEDEIIEFPEYVQTLENNTLWLDQINSVSNVEIDLPIRYITEEYVNKDIISKDCIIRFSGTYVDGQGNETSVEKEELLTVSWKDERSLEVETGITKYIDYGQGIVLQSIIKINNIEENNRLPIKNLNIKASVPILAEKAPEKVLVVANSLEGLNGEGFGNTNFDENNWNYNHEENSIEINVENKEKLIKESDYNEEYIIEEDDGSEENRFLNSNGTEEFLVTYTYPGIKIEDIENSTISNIDANIVLINDEEISNSGEYEYDLSESLGNMVSLGTEVETKEISKAYSYINYKREGRYETEIADNKIINISYKDLIKNLKIEDLSNYYINKDESILGTEDLYYKYVEISKSNFDSMIGEDGSIKIIGPNGEDVGLINKDTEADEEGYIRVNINDRFSKLKYEITKPISEGNIIIRSVKALSNLSIGKDSLINVDRLNTKACLKANFEYVEEEVLVEEKETSTKLKDTTTKATIKMDRDSLSTISDNKDVEIKIELNNAKDKSDIYGHSVFEVELPQYIENLDITNANIIYGEGLDITEIVAEGRVLRITIDGIQEGINSGKVINGTNIIVNADIKVNLYTPAKSEDVKLRYTNDEATSYSNNGEDKFEINYSAPTGLVAVNGITGFKDENSKVQSVRQGNQTGIIDIYSVAKTVTEEIVVMNNTGNKVTNVKVLGRFPFKGVKDIYSGEDLGTTLDAKVLSGLIADERNKAAAKIYYSTNGEATSDIELPENGWKETFDSLDEIKSYLIIPTMPEEIGLEDTDVLRYTYQYEIPGNLDHNEKIAGTFLVEYTNDSDLIGREEKEPADLVSLSTGEGPELEVKLIPDRLEVKEYEELLYTLNIKNIGETTAEEIIAEIPVPDGTEYIVQENDDENIVISVEERENEVDNNKQPENMIEREKQEISKELAQYMPKKKVIVIKIQKIEKNSEEIIDLLFKVKKVFISGTDAENETDEIEKIQTDNFPETFINANVSVNAKELGKSLLEVADKVEVKQAILIIEEQDLNEKNVHQIGKELNFRISLNNRIYKNIEGLDVVQALPDTLEFVKANVLAYNSEKEIFESFEGGDYDESTNSITWNIDDYYTNERLLSTIYLNYTVKVKDLPEGITKDSIELKAIAESDAYGLHESNSISCEIGKPLLVVTQTSDNSNTYIKPGDIVKYTFLIRNEGGAKATNIELKDVVPSGMIINKVSYTDPTGNVSQKTIISSSASIETYELNPNEEVIADVELKASYENATKETSVTNYGVLNADNEIELTTNSITHIIEKTEEEKKKDGYIPNDTPNDNSNIVQTYKIEGKVWEDSNKDGMKNINEKMLDGITVKLINKDGVLQNTTKTNNEGKYTFRGIENGSYFVIFEYDYEKYSATTYRKDGVGLDINSDAITTKLEQNGKETYGAITDTITISNSSASDIDLGLAFAEKFDLKIDKTISKITTQTAKDSTTENYDNVKMAKTEIASRNIAGSIVYVEYNITVSNVGDVNGYAKKIVDYIPKGMKFNSSLEANSDWYTGTDGNLYSSKLENIELKKGESKTLKLVLTKEMTPENTGINNNQVEIYEDYNIYGLKDKNSSPGNKMQNENDLSSADAVILIKTGRILTNSFITIFILIIGTMLGSVIRNKIRDIKRRVVI